MIFKSSKINIKFYPRKKTIIYKAQFFSYATTSS